MADNETKRVKPENIQTGDIITFNAQVMADGKPRNFRYNAVVFEQKFAPRDDGIGEELIGFSVMILAPPGTFKGNFAAHSVIINDPNDLKDMGLQGNQRLYFSPVVINKNIFPDIHGEYFKVGIYDSDPAAIKLGRISNNKTYRQIMGTARHLENQHQFTHLSIKALEKLELKSGGLPPINPKPKSVDSSPKPASEQPKSTSQVKNFEQATKYDMTLTNAIKAKLVDDFFVEKLTRDQSVYPPEEQKKAGIISGDDEPVTPLQTVRELERLLEQDEGRLRAFFGNKSGGKMYQSDVVSARNLVNTFNAAESANVFNLPEFAQFVFKIGEPQ